MWIWPSSRLRPPAATAPTSASKATGARPSTCARERVSRRPPSSAAPLPPARGDPSSLCKDPLFAGRAARRKEGPAPTAQAHGPAQPWGAGTAQGHGPLAQAQTPAGARAARRPLVPHTGSTRPPQAPALRGGRAAGAGGRGRASGKQRRKPQTSSSCAPSASPSAAGKAGASARRPGGNSGRSGSASPARPSVSEPYLRARGPRLGTQRCAHGLLRIGLGIG